MIAPLEDKVDGLVDRILPYGDELAGLSDRVKPFGKVDPLGAPPRYAGPFLPGPPLKYGVLVNFQPNQPLVPAIQFSPNAAAVTISVDPNATLAPVINNTPGQPKPIGVITDPIAPGAVVVGQDPKAPAVTTVVQSPNAPAITVEHQPNKPLVVSSGNNVLMPASITVQSDPNAVTITQAEAYENNAPHIGLWRYSSVQTDYISILVPFGFANSPNEPDYPLGYENEIVKIQKYLSSTGGPFDLLQTDDGLIGGTETAQIFELSDRGSTWEYVEFANTPLASDYSLYRGITRPPLAPAFVGIASEPNGVVSVTIEHDPNAAQLVTSEHSPGRVSTVTLSKSPDQTTIPVIVSDPNAPVIDRIIHTPPVAVQIPVASIVTAPNQVAPITVSTIPQPVGIVTTIKLLSRPGIPVISHNPNAPQVVTAGARPVAPQVPVLSTAPNSISIISVDHIPEAPAIVTAISKPVAVTTPVITVSPNAPQVIETNPGAPAVVSTQLMLFAPNAPQFLTSVVTVGMPALVTVEHSPNAATLKGLLVIQKSPSAPQIVTSGESASAPQIPVVSHTPNTPQTVSVVGVPNQTLVPTVQNSPNTPQTITVGGKPGAVDQVFVAHGPGQVSSVTSVSNPAAPTLNSIFYITKSPSAPQAPVIGVSARPTAPQVPVVLATPVAPQAPVIGLFVGPNQTLVPTVSYDPNAPQIPIINTAPNAVAAVNTTITGLLTPNAPRTPIRVGAFPYATFPPTADFIYDEPVRWQNKEYIREGSELLVNGTLDAVQQIVADPQNDGTNGGAGDAPVNIIVLDPFALGDPSIVFPVGTVLHGVGGGGGGALQRMEDPNDPRDYPYWSSNQNTGNWEWVNMSDRGTKWEYATPPSTSPFEAPVGWTKVTGAADTVGLYSGFLTGYNTDIVIKQMFSSPVGAGTYTVVFERPYADVGILQVAALTSTGNSITLPWTGSTGTNNTQNCTCINTASVEVPSGTLIYGLKVLCFNGRTINSVSFFEGVKAAGVVTTYPGGGIEKTAGPNGYNTGASSAQTMSGNRDGYTQFQVVLGKSLEVGLTYKDVDFGNFQPYWLSVNGNGSVNAPGFPSTGAHYLTAGDWLRIRHYSASNQIQYQKKQLVDVEQPNDALTIGQKVLIKNSFSTGAGVYYVQGNYALVEGISGSGQPLLRKENSAASSYLSTAIPRGYFYEVIEEVEDYVTFHTASNPTNGSDLIIDTSLYYIGSRLSDVTIKTFF